MTLVKQVVGLEPSEQFFTLFKHLDHMFTKLYLQWLQREILVLCLLEKLAELGFGQEVHIQFSCALQQVKRICTGSVQLVDPLEELLHIFGGHLLVVLEEDVVHHVGIHHVGHQYFDCDFCLHKPLLQVVL